VDVVSEGDGDAVAVPARGGTIGSSVREELSTPPIGLSEPGERARLLVEDAEARLPKVLELTGVRIEQAVPLAVLIDGQQQPTVARELCDYRGPIPPVG